MSKKRRKKKGKKRTRPNMPRSSAKMGDDRVQPWLEPIRHVYPDGWQADDWLVPYIDHHACIYHGHEKPDNHDLCGPQIFCCVKASLLLTGLYPSWNDPKMDWQMTEGSHLVTWIPDAGVGMFYFFVCAPDDPNTLLFVGIKSSEARDVLLKQVPLDHYLDQAVIVS